MQLNKIIAGALLLAPAIAQAQSFNPVSFEREVQKIVKQVSPACVKIATYDTVSKKVGYGSFSGVVVTAEGHILTAAHATLVNQVYLIKFPDGSQQIGKALSRVQAVDESLIKIITPGKWPYCEIGRSADLKINQPCLSIAYPATLSTLPRPVVRLGYVLKALTDSGKVQTTCLMEPGDSGGPVFDFNGRVVALHSRIHLPLAVNLESPVDNFLKYWDLLLKGVDIPKGTIPADSNEIKLPLYTKTIKTEEALTRLPKVFSTVKGKLDRVAVEIKSIYGTRNALAWGTVVSLDKNNKYVISKSSIVGDHPQIKLKDGDVLQATVIARDIDQDLVLLKATGLKDAVFLEPAFKDTLSINDEGRFLISALFTDSIRVGVLGNIRVNVPAFSKGFLDIKFAEIKQRVKVTYFDQPASAVYGLQIGDVIDSLNGVKVNSAKELPQSIFNLTPGNYAVFSIVRDGKPMALLQVIDKAAKINNKHLADYFEGGASLRSDVFKSVFVHDSCIRPEECGGPVFDTKGNFQGINISRLSRVNSLAVPYSSVYAFLKNNLFKRKKVYDSSPLHCCECLPHPKLLIQDFYHIH
jgi:serine protease Do